MKIIFKLIKIKTLKITRFLNNNFIMFFNKSFIIDIFEYFCIRILKKKKLMSFDHFDEYLEDILSGRKEKIDKFYKELEQFIIKLLKNRYYTLFYKEDINYIFTNIDDIVIEIIENLFKEDFKYIKQLENKKAFLRYLTTVVRNKITNMIKRKRKEKVISLDNNKQDEDKNEDIFDIIVNNNLNTENSLEKDQITYQIFKKYRIFLYENFKFYDIDLFILRKVFNLPTEKIKRIYNYSTENINTKISRVQKKSEIFFMKQNINSEDINYKLFFDLLGSLIDDKILKEIQQKSIDKEL